MNQFAAESKGSSYWLWGFAFGGVFLCMFFFSLKPSFDYKQPLLLPSLRLQRETAFSFLLAAEDEYILQEWALASHSKPRCSQTASQF